MDARHARAAVLLAVLVSLGAGHRTENFIVEAPTPEIAAQVGQAAEKYRHDLAIDWLGHAMPAWAKPCPIVVEVGPHLGAGGATSFVFDRGEVFNWRMNIQGPLDRVLDSVLPHEVTHTIFASHFRRPLPRWADEGACTTVEHKSERGKQQKMLITFLKTGRGIAFSEMFAMKEYPHDILPLYAQGHSLASFLLSQGGKQKFLEYVSQGMERERWSDVTREHYGYKNLAELQDAWLAWVRSGSPAIKNVGDSNTQLASQKQDGTGVIYRAQSEDRLVTAPAQLAAANAAGPVVPVDRPDGRPRRQVVLEWRHPDVNTSPASPAPASQGAAPGQPQRSVYDVRPRGTVMR